VKVVKKIKVGWIRSPARQKNPCDKAIQGFENVKPMVSLVSYPVKLRTTRSSLFNGKTPVATIASLVLGTGNFPWLGFGFRCWVPRNATYGDYQERFGAGV